MKTFLLHAQMHEKFSGRLKKTSFSIQWSKSKTWIDIYSGFLIWFYNKRNVWNISLLPNSVWAWRLFLLHAQMHEKFSGRLKKTSFSIQWFKIKKSWIDIYSGFLILILAIKEMFETFLLLPKPVWAWRLFFFTLKCMRSFLGGLRKLLSAFSDSKSKNPE